VSQKCLASAGAWSTLENIPSSSSILTQNVVTVSDAVRARGVSQKFSDAGAS